MFSKLKDKLKDWTKKIIEDKEEVIEIKEEEKSQKKDKKIKSEKSKTKEKLTKEETEKIEEKIKEEPTKEKEQQTEEKKEKKSFFKKILTGTIKTSEEEKPIETEKIEEEIKEEPIKETEKKIQITKKESVEEKIQETQKKKSFFEKILTGTIKISEEEFNNYSEELEMLLLENNVAFEVTEKVLGELKEKLVGKEIPRKELEQEIKNNLKEILKEILIEPFNIIEKIKEKSKRGEPYVILFCGINGTGKTTTIAKIAHMLKQEKLSCVIAAADTFRAAAIDQIKTHGERLDTKVIAHEYGSDPASVGFDAIKYAKKNNIPCVLIDTAGRIHTATNLLREMEKIVKVCKPDTKIFVGESITGNDAIEQVK